MRYFANYEADAVIREDDNGRRYIKRLNNLQETAISNESREAWCIPSFGQFNRLVEISRHDYMTFGKKWRWDSYGNKTEV